MTGARLAIDKHDSVCAPVSGFRHAHWAHGSGFRTFSGILVAALDVLTDGFVDPFAIIDCVFHDEHGTEDSLEHIALPLREHIILFKAGASFPDRQMRRDGAAGGAVWLPMGAFAAITAIRDRMSSDWH